MGLVEHLEAFLGPVTAGWDRDADGVRTPFQVALFDGCALPDTVAFSTLGLSRHALHSRVSGRVIRQELMTLVPGALASGPVPGILQQVANGVLASHCALLRGDVVGPAGPLVSASSMEAFYVTAPAYFPDEFHVFQEDGHGVVVAWLVPISRSEAAYIAEHGWSEFEERLVEADPDLVDVHRRPMRL